MITRRQNPADVPRASVANTESLMRMAIAGVLRHAQDGDLSLFAWTLGLSQEV